MASAYTNGTALVRKLASIFRLSDEETLAVAALPMQLAEIAAEQDIVREGDRPSRCCLLLSGMAYLYKITGAGRRQILAFQLAGDVPDLQSLHLRTMDSSLATLTACRVGFIRHEDVVRVCRQFPRVADALWRTTLIDAAIFREWIANVGQREAMGRLCHILCEIFVRSQAVGLTDGDSCPLPITQQKLGEATGMSTVHVNRTLQQVRETGLIRLRTGMLTIQDWAGLQAAGDFDSGYLHLHDPLSGVA